jgi:hypothetical protein
VRGIPKRAALAVAVAMAGAALSAPASASLRDTIGSQAIKAAAPEWSAWQRLPKPAPDTIVGCGTKIRLTYPMFKQELRTREDLDGNTRVQVRGPVHQRIAPTRGHAVVADITGQGSFTVYTSGDLLLRLRGKNLLIIVPKTYENSTPTTLPRIFLSTGRMAIFSVNNGTPKLSDDVVTFLRRPARHWGICPILSSGVVPKPFRV